MSAPAAHSHRDFFPEPIGRWGASDTFAVTREQIIRFAAATNDPIESHRVGDTGSPVFAVVASFAKMMQAVTTTTSPEVALRAVHGRQEFRFHRLIRPGDRISTRARPIGYKGGPKGTAVLIQLECRDRDDVLVNEQYTTAFFRGVDAHETVGVATMPLTFEESPRKLEPSASIRQHVDDDQTFRYSRASGDSMPIHLDEDVARRAGLPGIIVHGLCTQAIVSWGILNAVAEGDPARLKRYVVRFARPVLPGQEIATTIWRAGSEGGVTRYAFETTVGDTVVLKDGVVDIAAAGAD